MSVAGQADVHLQPAQQLGVSKSPCIVTLWNDRISRRHVCHGDVGSEAVVLVLDGATAVFRLLCHHFSGRSTGIYGHAAFHKCTTALRLFRSITFTAFVAALRQSWSIMAESDDIVALPENPADREKRPIGPNDYFVAVMGVTGVGKSSFIQHLSGERVEIGHTLEACMATLHVHLNDR